MMIIMMMMFCPAIRVIVPVIIPYLNFAEDKNIRNRTMADKYFFMILFFYFNNIKKHNFKIWRPITDSLPFADVMALIKRYR